MAGFIQIPVIFPKLSIYQLRSTLQS
jgi:hypothetical protein